MRSYFYKLLARYLSLYLHPCNTVCDIHPPTARLSAFFADRYRVVLGEGTSPASFAGAALLTYEDLLREKPDVILLDGNLHYEKDIQGLLEKIRAACTPATRLVVVYYSSLWRSFLSLATWLRLRDKMPEQNWIAHEDVNNLLLISDFEPVRRDQRVLMPFYIPFVSDFVNRYLAPLPFFRAFTLVNVLVARPVAAVSLPPPPPSVSVVVPARNEAHNIERVVQRLPTMGPDDELIFVEGHSLDDTWAAIQEVARKHGSQKRIIIAQQEGRGKGDAVRKGFSLATRDVFMILDADMTVPPEDLPKFYRLIVSGKGEFINGSRLVYPLETEAMRFWNILGNKFFALAFSFVLGQRFKDTLCGTKVLSKANYQRIAAHRSYFGDFDPFGDFDLLFGASRLGLKIVEIPISYKERTYGTTNISRWSHGVILLRMLAFAARKIKFI